MSRQCEPYRKMAADGARAENAYPHGGSPAGREESSLVFTSGGRTQPARRTGRVAGARPWRLRELLAFSQRSSRAVKLVKSAMMGRAT